MEISNEFKDEILDSIGEGLFTVDKEFRVIFFNSAAEKITKLNRKNVIGKFCKDVFKSGFCLFDCPIAKVLESGKNIFDLESRLNCFNGRNIPIKLNAAVLKNSIDEPVGGVISFREISDLENVEEYLKKNTQFYGIVGFSKPIIDIFNLIYEIADCDATVLIQGETGTGKELIANAIKETNKRKNKPYIKVNCSVLPPNLIASELFGHVKGAFTDAHKDRIGRFELADKGTIFLDEIAEMPLQTQLQLLRVIQEGTFEKVGDSITHKVDVRVIAATNLNIEKAIEEGRFREDLYYRLNVIPIKLPPLREREDDIYFLIQHFIRKFSLLYNKTINDINDDALDILSKYSWPGNIRELENAIEFAFIRTKANYPITTEKIPIHIRENRNLKNDEFYSLDSMKPTELIQLLEKHRWNKTKVAKELGVNRSTVWRRLKILGIDK